MSESMIERVAAAVAEHGGSNWESCLKAPGQKMAGMYRSMARAAIEAMREPTEEMQRAGSDYVYEAWGDGPTIAREAWQANIDAALNSVREPTS